MIDRPPASVLGRVTTVLTALEQAGVPLSVAALARRCGLPRSTTHRMLDELARLAWVERLPGGFGLGVRAVELGRSGGAQSRLRQVAAPTMHDLLMRTGQVVVLLVLDRSAEVTCLDKLGGAAAARAPVGVGHVEPCARSPFGPALASVVDTDLAERWRATGLLRGDAFAAPDLLRVRLRGTAVGHLDHPPGTTAVTAPIGPTPAGAAAVAIVGVGADVSGLARHALAAARVIGEGIGSRTVLSRWR